MKGFSIRTDFATAKTFGNRVLLVGEAAGLVNPLTGEGIDYALESGLIAAQRAAEMISADDYSERQYTHYDRLLREKYQRLFEFSNRIRILSLNPIALNSLQRWAHRRTDLTALLNRISHGDQPIPAKITPGRILRVLSGAKLAKFGYQRFSSRLQNSANVVGSCPSSSVKVSGLPEKPNSS